VLADKKALEKDKLPTIRGQSQGHASQRATAGEMLSDPPGATADATAAHKAPIEEDTARAEDKERKRKRAIVASDDEHDDHNGGRAKMSKVG
jgi:hypothetical protein